MTCWVIFSLYFFQLSILNNKLYLNYKFLRKFKHTKLIFTFQLNSNYHDHIILCQKFLHLFFQFSNNLYIYVWINIIYFCFSPSPSFYLPINNLSLRSHNLISTYPRILSSLLFPAPTSGFTPPISKRFQCTSHIRTSGETIFIRVCCSIPFLPFLVYTTLSLHTRQSNAYTCARVQLHFCGWRNHSVHRPRKYARDYF